MDNDDDDRSHFMTPCLTPHVSDRSTTQDILNMDSFARDLVESLNNNYPLNNVDYDSENESDVQDQQPTEATDDSILPDQIQADPVETTFVSLYPQPSQDRDDICSPSQDIEPSVDSFSAVVPDVDTICEIKSFDSCTLICNESHCVPFTDVPDEIAILKQASITTTITTEYVEPKKDKDDIGHIMLSYNHSTKPICSKIARALKNLNYRVWIDQDNITGDILTSMASAVENSFVVLMAINEPYFQSRYCRLEAEYSVERNKSSIPMLMQAGYKADGWLGLINGSKLHIDFTKLQFDEAFNLLLREIEEVRRSLGAEEMTRTSMTTMTTQSITTMNNSWNRYPNVHEWSADDVLDWLHRERLEIFANILTGFNGATLWQLYKIRFDSAPDYYRTIETLLPPDVPLRLFHNLTFNAALETLFSSSNQAMHR